LIKNIVANKNHQEFFLQVRSISKNSSRMQRSMCWIFNIPFCVQRRHHNTRFIHESNSLPQIEYYAGKKGDENLLPNRGHGKILFQRKIIVTETPVRASIAQSNDQSKRREKFCFHGDKV